MAFMLFELRVFVFFNYAMVGCIKDVTCEHNNLIPFDVYLQLYDG